MAKLVNLPAEPIRQFSNYICMQFIYFFPYFLIEFRLQLNGRAGRDAICQKLCLIGFNKVSHLEPIMRLPQSIAHFSFPFFLLPRFFPFSFEFPTHPSCLTAIHGHRRRRHLPQQLQRILAPWHLFRRHALASINTWTCLHSRAAYFPASSIPTERMSDLLLFLGSVIDLNYMH